MFTYSLSKLEPRKTSAIGLALTTLGLLGSSAAVQTESFDSDPFARGWKAHGETNLFTWDSQAGRLTVTWDSSRTNSYALLPLVTACTDEDDFSVAFDLRLSDFQAGVNPQKPNTFQIAFGFVNFESATAPQFLRGSGEDSPNLVEFAFFPDPFGMFDSLTGSMCDKSGTNWAFGYVSAALTPEDLYRVTLVYTASDRTLRTTVTRNGQPFEPISDAVIGPDFQGLKVNGVGVCSYNDAGQDPLWSGSILAHGTVDEIRVSVPDPVGAITGHLDGDAWLVECGSRSDYLYTLERTTDLNQWTDASATLPGSGAPIVLRDPAPPSTNAVYRVRAERQP